LEDTTVQGARGVIINVTGGPDLGLMEVNEASSIIHEAAHEDANIIFGAVVDPALEGKVKITVIATGFESVAQSRRTTVQTPTDMARYTNIARADQPAVAAAGGGGAAPAIIRRQPLDLSALPTAAGTTPPQEPAAETERTSAFDIPAFLRRQS
jgi:cell division protein FtsZ